MRNEKIYTLTDPEGFKKKLIFYLKKHNKFCFLDSNNQFDRYSSFNYLAAFGIKKELKKTDNPFDSLKQFIDQNKDWLFGHFSYDLKNYIEELESNNLDKIQFPKIHFFIPTYIFRVTKNVLTIMYDNSVEEYDVNELFNLISNENVLQNKIQRNNIKSTISREEYCSIVKSIKKNIQLGDVYEMNFCQEFFIEKNTSDPFDLFFKLNDYAKSPFSSFYRNNDCYSICSSPERFIKKENRKIISQPIKGTSERFDDLKKDEMSKESLLNSEKDFSENVMIVDLVRNDLSITAANNSVSVEELAKLYSYKNIHHLISTVVSKIDKNVHPIDVIKNCFPMGSMTGAPKIRSMELIEKHERCFRGIYSGSIGYFTPNLDFDFNVVIRSLLYNKKSNYLSFIVGGAITIESDENAEYQECLIKAKSIVDILNNEK